eukprot:SAG11_NODE_41748_length_190_cov_20.351648_1_plen_39_part_10
MEKNNFEKQIELSHDSCLYDCKKSTTKGVKITGKVLHWS